MVLFGADRAGEFAHLFTDRVALLTSPTGRTSDNRSTVEVLQRCCDLQLLLAPEHGIRGDKAAGALVEDEIDGLSGLRVRSLYTSASKGLARDTLALFDTLVYDIADVGCRYYTFISSLKNCMAGCAAAGKRLVVLDRPNPLGDRVEGGGMAPGMESFVGCHDIPVCYGLTTGELAGLFNRECGFGCDLHVVPCSGLNGSRTFRELGLPWLLPSPNIPRYDTALLYPGTCLLEGTNCSEGRGTADPFCILGAPFVRAEEFTRAFNDLKLPGVLGTPIYFTPSCSKHQGSICGGVHLHITDEETLRPVELGLRLLALLKGMYPRAFRLLETPEWGKPFLSVLSGHRELEAEDWDVEGLLSRYERQAAAFRSRKAPYELYPR